MNLLFICSQNQVRSPTAEACFAEIPGLEVLSAGTDARAITPGSLELVEWAEIIFVMEAVHRRRLQGGFGPALRDTKVVVLEVPDDFGSMDPELVGLVYQRVTPHLRLTPEQQAALQQRRSPNELRAARTVRRSGSGSL